jgi:RNA polymerase-binding transcription factor DksA/very-short-patch-repair endonuclease
MTAPSDTVDPEALVRYLRDLAQLRTRPILRVDDYEFVKWFDDVPRHRSCQSVVAEELLDRTEWLIVDRVELPQRPDPPESTLEWLNVADLDRPNKEPSLRAAISRVTYEDTGDGRQAVTTEHLLEDYLAVQHAWEGFLPRWRKWAELRRALDPVHELYTDLFRAAERARQVGEQYETVVAVGLATLRGERGSVRRHLVTAPAQITLDAQTGRITVEPAGETNTAIRLEQDMFAPDETPPADVQGTVRDRLDRLDPLDLDEVGDVIATWTHAASAEGTFSSELSANTDIPDELHVRLAPAIIMRPRSQQALVDTYETILREMREGVEVPATFGELATTSSTPLTDDDQSAGGLDLASEQWFPLPANAEQSQIVDALGSRRGVIVHGPPGTGKSHTIANLISHALATGSRVLVTAHSARALEVLSDKLPKDIRSLTVTMLGQGRRGTDDLERSANEILRRRQDPQWKPAAIKERLTRLSERLAANRSARQKLVAELAQARATETRPVELGFGGYSGTLAEVAARIAGEPGPPDWFDARPAGPPPLSDSDIEELVALAAQLTPDDLAIAEAVLPDTGKLPDPNELEQERTRMEQATARVEEFSDISADLLDLFEDLDEAALSEYIRAANDVDAVHQSIGRRQAAWTQIVLADIDRGQSAAWHALRQSTATYLAEQRHLASVDALHVELPDLTRRPALRAQAAALHQFLHGGGKIGFFKAKPVKAAEELRSTVAINGAPPDSAEACEAFIHWCDEHAALEQVERSWPSGAIAPQPTLVLRHAALSDAAQALHECFYLVECRQRLREVIARHDIDVDLLPADPRLMTRAADASAAHAENFRALESLERVLTRVRHATDDARMDPVAAAMRAAAEQSDVQRYKECWDRVQRLAGTAAVANRYLDQLGILAAALPGAANMIRSGDGSRIRDLETEWDRARARTWLAAQDRLDSNALVARIGTIDELTRELVTEIGANRAWLHAIGRLTDAHTQHLKGYQTAMKRVGKGTGKYAPKYRAEARAHLAHCRDAVPAWVMPAHQVASNIAPEPGAFDLVIIDEASQSGVEELFLFWLGKQVVVVGDKQQISPDGSFVKGEAQALQRRHLDGWTFAGEFGPENSLFDVAEVKYVAGEVWLSEHFRSMPEIIEYSNQLCYADHRLEPVRQFGSDRLTPLRSTLVPHVPDGRPSSKRVNRHEAEAVVQQLLDCLEDPEYTRTDGGPMTFGVISLLGTDQAKLIQQRLLELVDTDVWIERRIHVGDASDFQGDERDVIFLSMVTTPPEDGRRVPKLGHDRDRRRFNVAASRARDQLWLFHSVEHHQLNPECPRARLLAHIANPTRAGLEGFEGPVDPNELRSPFESLFEQRVFLDLVNRGHVVVPQWTILGYRIDLVVVGANARLAVECDGDAWHGPDAYAADLGRQRDLERVGWRFVRIKEWEYYADKAAALEPMWKALGELGIGPGGDAASPSPSPPSVRGGAMPQPTKTVSSGPQLVPPPFRGEPPPLASVPALPGDVPDASQSPYDDAFLRSQRTQLLEERQTIHNQIEALRAEADALDKLDVAASLHDDAASSSSNERDFDLARAAAAEDTIIEIDAALERIDRGVYGICEISGQPIPRERLEAIPYARERVEYKRRSFG